MTALTVPAGPKDGLEASWRKAVADAINTDTAAITALQAVNSAGPTSTKGAGAPSGGSPVDGDSYYDTTNHRAYRYVNGTWYVQEGGAFTSFTPQLDQGVTTNIAKTVNISEYRYDGPFIDWTAYLTVTGTGTAGTGISLTMPVAPLNGLNARAIGNGYVYDSSLTTLSLSVPVCLLGAALLSFWTNNTTGSYWGANAPNLAIAGSDQIAFSVRYRWV